MTETALSAAITTALEQLGYWVIRLNSGKVKGRRGWIHLCPAGTPDLMVLMPCVLADPGTVLFLEVKLPGGKASAEQEAWHQRARRMGHRVSIVSSVREAIKEVGR